MKRFGAKGLWIALILIGVGCDDAPGTGGDPQDAAVDGAAAGGAGGGGGMGGEVPGDGALPDADLPSCFTDTECAADRYCALVNGFDGVCALGCRPDPQGMGPGNCEGRTICSPEHQCVPDPRCIDDSECADQTTFCQDGACVAGCRPDPDNCLPDDEGRSRQCNPATRTCERLVACCDGGTCATAREGTCEAPVEGVFSCFVEDLCDQVCQSDANCLEDSFCDGSLCAPGCRLDDEESCPGQRCDEVSRACVPNPCGSDGDCARTQFCAPQGCLQGCRVEPDNCPAGQECGPNRICRATGGCVDDDACVRDNGAGWRCIEGACEQVCLADEDCAGGQFCDAGACVDGCRDDDLEPNNARAEATALEVVAGMPYRSEPVVACDLDRDWYSFRTARGFGARVTIRFRDGRGDLDLRVHPPEGAAVTSAGQADDETVEIRDVAAAGTWYVEVYARGLDTNDYRLEVDLLPPGGCVPDEAEAVGDDSAATAFAVEVPGLQDVQLYAARTVCGVDEDWYRLPLGDGDGLRIEVTVDDPAAPALDFALFGPGLPAAGAQPTFIPNGGDALTLTFTAPRPSPQIAAGEWYLRVWSPEGGATTYDLRVAVDRVRALCLIDSAEPNLDAQNAFDLMQVRGFTRPGLDGVRELVPGSDLDLANLWLCGGDEDWFTFEARAGDDLAVSVVRTDPQLAGPVAVEVRDALGAIVGLPGQSDQRLVTARADGLPRGRYFVRVASPEPLTQAQYTLRLDRTAGPVVCMGDRYEAAPGNGVRGLAAQVRPGVIEGLTLCGTGGDEDWFALTLDGVSDLTVRALFSHLQADLEVDVFQGDAAMAENANSPAGHSQDDDEEVVLADRLPGTWYIRVRASGGGDARYTLEIEVAERAFVCEDDPDEPNDSEMLATDLGAGVVNRANQWICDRVPAEVDTFRFRVPGGLSRTVAATFVYGDDGDLVLEVLNGQGQVLATTAGIPRELSKQCITLPSFVADRSLFLRVVPLSINRVLDDDERLDYRLRIVGGTDCEVIEPLTPGIRWPAVPLPN